MVHQNQQRWEVELGDSSPQPVETNLQQPFTVALGGAGRSAGRSVVAANLAAAMARGGKKVVLMDANLSSPEQHTHFKIPSSDATIVSFLKQELISLNQAMQPSEYENLSLISAAGARPEMAQLNFIQKQRIQHSLSRLEADIAVLDMGDQSGASLWDFFTVADYRVLVAPPHSPSLAATYHMIKKTVQRLMELLAHMEGKTSLLASLNEKHGQLPMAAMLELIEAQDPRHARLCRTSLKHFNIGLIMTEARGEPHRRMAHELARMVRYFLCCPATVLALFGPDPLEGIHGDPSAMTADAGDEAAQQVTGVAHRLAHMAGANLQKQRMWSPEQLLDGSGKSEWKEEG